MKEEIEASILHVDVRLAALKAVVQFGAQRGAVGLEMSRYLDSLQEELQAERDKLNSKLERVIN